MKATQIAAAIQTIVRLQLDDCKRAIKEGKRTVALKELEDAMRQLKSLAGRLEPAPHGNAPSQPSEQPLRVPPAVAPT